MSAFDSKLDVELVNQDAADGRGTWRLTAPLVYHSDIVGTVMVPQGFMTDFASVPRWIPVASALLLDTASEAAVVHDWLYQAPHPISSRSEADAVLKEAAITSGVSRWVAWALWAGVRVGGASHWK